VPAASKAFDIGIMLAGVVITIVSVVSMQFGGEPFAAQLVLAVPTIVVMTWFPLLLTRSSGGIEIGFDSCVLVFLALVTAPEQALVIWAVSTLVAQLTTQKKAWTKAFNVGLGVLAGFLAVRTMTAISSLDRTSARELLAVAAGCAVYFVVDYVVSGVSLALEERQPFLNTLAEPSAVLALCAFVAIDSLGYLGALVVRTLPSWTGLMLVVPLVVILVAARALSRGNEHQRRLSLLLDAAVRAQSLKDTASVLDALRTHARNVVGDDAVQVRPEPPGDGEAGAVVRQADTEVWVVGPARSNARSSAANDKQALEALAAMAEEALARVHLVDEMAHLARHDSLTGLANRTLFQDRVEHALELQQRRRGLVAVLYCDLDAFKAVNDRFGHEVGDELLAAVSRRLRDCLRPGDTVARLGGDEFAVLLEDAGHLEGVRQVCVRILEALRPSFELAGRQVSVGTSIGVALSADAEDAGALLRNADMAMYRAKSLGKGRFEVYLPALRDESLRRLELLERLRVAVDCDELVLHYQPVVDLSTGTVNGFEALLRWQRPEGLLGPDSFIAAAEESGLISTLGEWVVEQACADSAALVEAAQRPLSIGVNVSAHQLRGSGLVDQVRRLRATLGPRVNLVLEMTESVLIGDDAETMGSLHQLHALGARLAIDDFGTGFSSIGYLQHLPVDILKIDRSFTAKIGTDTRSAALVEAMVLMSAALELVVVAEGIETPEQSHRLRAMGCAVGQGFLFARPLPLDDALALLRAGPVAVPGVDTPFAAAVGPLPVGRLLS